MTAISTHVEALRWARQLLDLVTADLTPSQAHALPAGIANPIGATYAHAVIGADAVINVLLAGSAPLYMTTFAGRTGISHPQWQSTLDWARSVQVDLPALHSYSAAVFAAAEQHILGMTEADLEVEIDLTGQGLGVRSRNWALSALLTGHVHNMAGEISALKGVLGAKGYPF